MLGQRSTYLASWGETFISFLLFPNLGGPRALLKSINFCNCRHPNSYCTYLYYCIWLWYKWAMHAWGWVGSPSIWWASVSHRHGGGGLCISFNRVAYNCSSYLLTEHIDQNNNQINQWLIIVWTPFITMCFWWCYTLYNHIIDTVLVKTGSQTFDSQIIYLQTICSTVRFVQNLLHPQFINTKSWNRRARALIYPNLG